MNWQVDEGVKLHKHSFEIIEVKVFGLELASTFCK